MVFKSLTGKLLFVGAIAFVNTTFYVSAEHIFTRHIRGEATRINMAGHMRFRSFEMGWLLHRMKEDNGPHLRKDVMGKIEAFEGIAGALKTGVSDKDEAQALDGIINKWKGGIRPAVTEALEYPADKGKAAIERYDSAVSGYVQEIDGFVGMLEGHFNRQIRRFDVFRAYALGLFTILSLFIFFYIKRSVIKPIKRLTDVSRELGKGNFEAKIDVKGNDDIALLAGTMNEMAAGLKGAIINLEEMVRERTEAAAAANEEMMASNEELQAAYSQLEEAHHDLSRATDELKSMDRLKSEFLQTVSHELRSPITPILGYLEMMRDGEIDELTEKQKEVVEEMHICGKNMQMIVDEIVEVASINAQRIMLELEEVEFTAVLWNAIKGVRQYAEEKRVTLEPFIPSGPFTLTGDRERLYEIFTHLLRNAVKFNRDGGKIRIDASEKEDGFEVSVSDTGIGIPNEKLDKIFDGFYQADSSATRHFEGVGLGLYLVKRLVELHNGRISVESEIGKGTVFRVFLPNGRRNK